MWWLVWFRCCLLRGSGRVEFTLTGVSKGKFSFQTQKLNVYCLLRYIFREKGQLIMKKVTILIDETLIKNVLEVMPWLGFDSVNAFAADSVQRRIEDLLLTVKPSPVSRVTLIPQTVACSHT